MTECNGCGQCCEVVALSYRQTQADILKLRGEIPEDEAKWAKECLVPMSRRVVKELQPDLLHLMVPPPHMVNARLRAGTVIPFYYSCKNWDSETKMCTDYENRPNLCKGFPWFDGRPSPHKYLPPQCSFRADVGLPIEDIPVKMGKKPDDNGKND